MKRLLAFVTGALLFALVGCGGDYSPNDAAPEPRDPDVTEINYQGNGDTSLSVREQHGLPPLAPDVDQGWNPESGEPLSYDDDGDEFAPYYGDGPQDKTVIVSLHGWSLNGGISQSGIHAGNIVPNISTISSMSAFAGASRGRCGRYDGIKDNAYYPCAVPKTQRSQFGDVVWTYRIDNSSCAGMTAQQNIDLASALTNVSTSFETNGHVRFRVTTSNSPSVWVRCASASEQTIMNNAGATLVGYPSGALTFGHSGPSLTVENCEDPVGAGSVAPATGAAFFYAVNEFYYYSRGEIVMNWPRVRQFIDVDCAPGFAPVGQRKDVTFMQYFLAHELWHILGFQHQSDITTVNNNMLAAKSCLAGQAGKMGRVRMRDAINYADLPNNSQPLTQNGADLSCYSPL
jgi:hypothetical protein